MGAILGRQSYDVGRIRILVHDSLVQKLLNVQKDSNIIIIETKMNSYINHCHISDVQYFTSYQKTCRSTLNYTY